MNTPTTYENIAEILPFQRRLYAYLAVQFQSATGSANDSFSVETFPALVEYYTGERGLQHVRIQELALGTFEKPPNRIWEIRIEDDTAKFPYDSDDKKTMLFLIHILENTPNEIQCFNGTPVLSEYDALHLASYEGGEDDVETRLQIAINQAWSRDLPELIKMRREKGNNSEAAYSYRILTTSCSSQMAAKIN